ncbi:MAG: Gfo/Idh/MocA family protein, partial [Halobacteriaceae archaeon]
DVDEELAAETGDEYDVPYTTDYRDIVSADIDCVVISVPNKFHNTIGVEAMESGKHVFCEKPLARNPEEGQEMVEAAAENDVTLKVGSNLRYFESVRKAKELLDESAIGDILFLRAWIGNDGEQLKDSWFADEELSGGGTFLDNGCHVLDISRWFLGEVKEGTGYVSTLHHPIDVEDNGFGLFQFDGGQTVSIQSSWTEWDDYMYMEIYGSDGSIKVDARMPNSKVTLSRTNGYRKVFDFSKLSPQSYDMEFDTHMQTLLDQREPEPSGFDGLRAVEMAHGIYEAAEEGRTVDLAPDQELRSFSTTVPLQDD